MAAIFTMISYISFVNLSISWNLTFHIDYLHNTVLIADKWKKIKKANINIQNFLVINYVTITTLLLGLIYHPFGKTWYHLSVFKIWQL